MEYSELEQFYSGLPLVYVASAENNRPFVIFEDSGILLTWNLPNINDESWDHVRIYRGTSPNPISFYQLEVLPKSSEYIDLDVEFGVQYYYKVQFFDSPDYAGGPSRIGWMSDFVSIIYTGNTYQASVISGPINGIQDLYLKTESLGGFINSNNLEILTINGKDFSNRYVEYAEFPAKIGGYYLVHYKGNYAWSHFEIGGEAPPDPTDEYIPISAPFSHSGAGEFYWITEDIPEFINSWEVELLEINGVDYTWQYKNSEELPDQAFGYYYIHFVGIHAWSHFEMGSSDNPNPDPTPDPPTPDPPTPDPNYVPISGPFSHDGAGDFYWKTESIPNEINSWNLEKLEINNVDYTNLWAGGEFNSGGNQLPAKINGYYYIHYTGNYEWSHFGFY